MFLMALLLKVQVKSGSQYLQCSSQVFPVEGGFGLFLKGVPKLAFMGN